MIIEILFKLIFWTWPIPGAPGLSLISNPPWYDAKTSPNPVLHSISTSCAICATSILDSLPKRYSSLKRVIKSLEIKEKVNPMVLRREIAKYLIANKEYSL